jgi:hypothetical protein
MLVSHRTEYILFIIPLQRYKRAGRIAIVFRHLSLFRKISRQERGKRENKRLWLKNRAKVFGRLEKSLYLRADF